MKNFIDDVSRTNNLVNFLLLLPITILLFAGFNLFDSSILEQKKSLKNEATKLLQSGDDYKPVVDKWGNAVDYNLETSDNANKATIRSAGPDGILLTEDDIVVEQIDLNKSRIAGEWIGQKSKQAVKGFFSGIFK